MKQMVLTVLGEFMLLQIETCKTVNLGVGNNPVCRP